MKSLNYSLQEVSCDFPYWRFEVMPEGKIHHCCPTWLPQNIGKITDFSILEAFEGDISKKIRESIELGEFKYCDKKLCPYLSQYVNLGEIRSPIHKKKDLSKKDYSLEHTKRILIMLNYDPSCNLRCPSCRNETRLFTEENASDELKAIHLAVMKNIRELREKDFFLHLNITGSGDAFASPLYFRLLRELEYSPRMLLEIQTNGTLMEENRFTDAMYRMIHFLTVSVDAASQPVYELVRRGGNFDRLVKNLDWMDKTILGGRFEHKIYYKINFIVQKDNFREMVNFAKWILSYSSVSEIWFNLIADWGHLPKNDFDSRAIWQKEHPDHEEFLELVKNPILRNPRINLGNLTTYL